jgi:hypothetical protein
MLFLMVLVVYEICKEYYEVLSKIVRAEVTLETYAWMGGNL